MADNKLQETIMNTLDKLYDSSLKGLPKQKSCYEIADEYLVKFETPDKASKELIKWQVAKCTTSGFVTSLGGLITLPVAIPANLGTVWYMQLRMIASIATMAGLDPSDDMVRTLAYVCLTGSSIADICKKAGVQIGNKLTMSMIKKIPGTVFTKINKAVGFRLITKFGSKGAINLGKMVPVVGGIIGGGMDFVSTQIIGKKAYEVFLLEKLD